MFSLLTRIPWGKIVKYGPTIVEMAEKIYDKINDAVSKRGNAAAESADKRLSLSALDARLAVLEANELQQAKLISDLAHQANDLTAALQAFSRRLLVTAVLAVTAITVSIATIIVVLVR